MSVIFLYIDQKLNSSIIIERPPLANDVTSLDFPITKSFAPPEAFTATGWPLDATEVVLIRSPLMYRDRPFLADQEAAIWCHRPGRTSLAEARHSSPLGFLKMNSSRPLLPYVIATP